MTGGSGTPLAREPGLKGGRRAASVEAATPEPRRRTVLADVLADLKVRAVDEVWPGLKPVIRKGLRGAAGPEPAR